MQIDYINTGGQERCVKKHRNTGGRGVFVDVDGGRRTRVHLRSFEQGGLNTRNLGAGDELTLRKECFIHEFGVTKWEVVSAPMAAHAAEAVRHIPRLLSLNTDSDEDMPEYL